MSLQVYALNDLAESSLTQILHNLVSVPLWRNEDLVFAVNVFTSVSHSNFNLIVFYGLVVAAILNIVDSIALDLL